MAEPSTSDNRADSWLRGFAWGEKRAQARARQSAGVGRRARRGWRTLSGREGPCLRSPRLGPAPCGVATGGSWQAAVAPVGVARGRRRRVAPATTRDMAGTTVASTAGDRCWQVGRVTTDVSRSGVPRAVVLLAAVARGQLARGRCCEAWASGPRSAQQQAEVPSATVEAGWGARGRRFAREYRPERAKLCGAKAARNQNSVESIIPPGKEDFHIMKTSLCQAG